MGFFRTGNQDMQGWEARGASKMGTPIWTPAAPKIASPKVSSSGQVIGPYPSSMNKTAMGLYVPPKPKLWAAANSNGSAIVSGLAKLFPALVTVHKDCPACTNHKGYPLSDIIVHLNDHHRWPREKVADWLEVISLDNPDIDLTIIGGKKDEAGTDKQAA